MTQLELEQLLSEMPLEEKTEQMLQIMGNFMLPEDETVLTGPLQQMGFTNRDIQLAGSVIGSLGAEKVKKIQNNYLEHHPHNIPLLFMLDVINGFKTIFPIPLAQGATFEPQLSKRCAKASAKEAAVSGVHVTFAPMVDLVRDARWGRVMESTGEDTYLNQQFSSAMVEGFQGEDLKDEYSVAACVKHFAGYGAPAAGRDYNTVELCEHTFREFYLPAYKAGIDAGAALVMTSFNTINGIPASTNKWLMRNILRDEMGFDGVLISDFSAIAETIKHGHSENAEDAAKKAVEAGVDIDMMTNTYSAHLSKLVMDGIVDEKLINESVMRILQLKNKLGLFENPYKDANEEKEKTVILCKEHRMLAREAACKSFVLLKNEQLLPINKEQKIAFIGPYVNNHNINGSWSFIGEAKDTISLEEAAREVLDSENVCFQPGCPVLGNEKLVGFREILEEDISPEEQQQMLKAAIEAAKEADIVILAVGEHYLQTGEAASRAMIEIPEIQMELFREVYRVNANIAVVLFNGRPLDLREINEKSKAVLEVWMPGTEGGHAVMDVLTGAVNPSGKLSMSFPYCVGQVPVHYNEYSTGRPHRDGVDQERFLSKYLDIPNRPLYAFGYGLSYTTFEISPLSLNQQKMNAKDTITVSVQVKNTGKLEGTEVVQLYIQDITASVVRPVKQLKAFEKVTLQPGEVKTVSFSITEEMLRFYLPDNTYTSEPGKFRIFAGSDSNTENVSEFELL